ncbi:hypothetical protein CWI36_0706p0010 [Hamiltosporidium magnivora]|uniref:Uncharacterized protein n=1 Tax=Hamiltosporidium magnivora TaxID=148818 RepID=A0A4Q9LBX0_9MICR|nr:hypothetical protein CWI36_0706p0010 [Hamiltosporidium magnivora]
MGIKKKVDSENIKNEKIKAVNKSENSAREIKSCDVDDTTISERLLSQRTIHKTNYQANIARLVFQFTLDSIKAAEQELPRSDLYSTTEIYENAQKWLVCNSELSASQTKSIGEIMRVFNLDLSKTNDLSETLDVKKFRMNGNRKKLRRKNRKFRLFRGRYNRTVFCYIQDRNAFWGDDGMCQQCKQSRKTLDHLATRSKKMLGHDYTRRYNEVQPSFPLKEEPTTNTNVGLELEEEIKVVKMLE